MYDEKKLFSCISSSSKHYSNKTSDRRMMLPADGSVQKAYEDKEGNYCTED